MNRERTAMMSVICVMIGGLSAFSTFTYAMHQIHLREKQTAIQARELVSPAVSKIYQRKLGEYCGSFGYDYKFVAPFDIDKKEFCTRDGFPDIPVDSWAHLKIFDSSLQESKTGS